MHCLKRFVVALSTTAISIVGSTLAASAQSADKYTQVGTDKNGDPVLLETATIYKTTQKLFLRYGDGNAEVDFRVSCVEGTFWQVGFAAYDSAGNLIGRERKRDAATTPKSGTPSAIALATVCHAVHAQGW